VISPTDLAAYFIYLLTCRLCSVSQQCRQHSANASQMKPVTTAEVKFFYGCMSDALHNKLTDILDSRYAIL